LNAVVGPLLLFVCYYL